MSYLKGKMEKGGEMNLLYIPTLLTSLAIYLLQQDQVISTCHLKNMQINDKHMYLAICRDLHWNRIFTEVTKWIFMEF